MCLPKAAIYYTTHFEHLYIMQIRNSAMHKSFGILTFLAIIFVVSPVCYAQWNFVYGSRGYDDASSIQQTIDGGYVVAGCTKSFVSGSDDFWVLKLNSDGSVAWQKTYGRGYANSIQQTTDGGYMFAGIDEEDNSCVFKLNSDGSVAWQRTIYIRNGKESCICAKSIQQTIDKGYVVAGSIERYGGDSDFWVLKLNSDGSMAWQKSYGDSDNDYANSIQQTTDGGYVVAGSSCRIIHRVILGEGKKGNFWVLKLNSDGSVAWQKSYGDSGYDYANSIKQTSDGGYVVTGGTESFSADVRDLWILKLYSDGGVAWQKSYGGSDSDYASSIQQTIDGGYVVAGCTKSFVEGSDDFWVLRLSSNGNIAWQKTYGKGHANSIQQTIDGGYVVAGGDSSDLRVFKLDSVGDISGCDIIRDSNAIVADTTAKITETSISPVNCAIPIANTIAKITETSVSPVDFTTVSSTATAKNNNTISQSSEVYDSNGGLLLIIVGAFGVLLLVIGFIVGFVMVWSADAPPGHVNLSAGSIGLVLMILGGILSYIAYYGSKANVTTIAFSLDGSLLAEGNNRNKIKLWDVNSKENIATLKGHSGSINSVAFSPDGSLLASGSRDGKIKLWDVGRKKKVATFKGHSGSVNSVAFSPNGSLLASGSDDNEIRLWNVSSKKNIAILTGHPGSVISVVFSPNGILLASGGGDGTIKLWDVISKKNIATFVRYSGSVNSVVFSPNSSLLASGSDDNEIRLWDVISKKNIATLEGHPGNVILVVFSPNGNQLTSGSVDGTVKLWNVISKKNIATFEGRSGSVNSVAFSPNGTLLASGSVDGKIIFQQMEPYMKNKAPNSLQQ
jgi:uncharacterized delta-60 repeat protein